MGKTFLVPKRLELGFLGEAWKNSYIDYNAFTTSDLLSMSEISDAEADRTASFKKMLSLLKEHFISGTGHGPQGDVELEADDLDALPVEVINKSIELLNGVPSPN